MAFRQPWVDIWIGIKGYSITRELRFVKVWNVASFSDIPEILKSPKGLWFQGSWKYVDVLMFSSLFDRTDFNYIIVIIRNLKNPVCIYIYTHTESVVPSAMQDLWPGQVIHKWPCLIDYTTYVIHLKTVNSCPDTLDFVTKKLGISKSLRHNGPMKNVDPSCFSALIYVLIILIYILNPWWCITRQAVMFLLVNELLNDYITIYLYFIVDIHGRSSEVNDR